MWNGFYDMSSIKDEDTLKNLYREALELSTYSHVDEIVGWERKTTDIKPIDYINNTIKLDHHNCFINRKAYHAHTDVEGEIVSTHQGKYVFIYVSLNDLYMLADKYNLTQRFFGL